MMQILHKIYLSFNNIEIATFILFIILLISFKTFRDCTTSFFKFLIGFIIKNKVFQLTLLELSLYFILISFILYKLNIWNITLLKDSIFWFILSGVILYKDVISEKNWQIVMKEYLLKVLFFSAIYGFLINIFSLPIWILLLLIPLSVILQMVISFNEDRKEYEKVNKYANNLLVTIGLGILVYLAHSIIKNYKIILSIQHLKAFLLPIIYTLTFLPFSLIFKLYFEYNLAYKRLTWRCDIQIPVNLNYLFKIFLFCKFDFIKLNKFLFFLTSSKYLNQTTNIQNLINEFKRRTTFLPFDSTCKGFNIEKTLNLFKNTYNTIIDDYKDIEYNEGFGSYFGFCMFKMDRQSFSDIEYSVSGTNQEIQHIQISYQKSRLTPNDLSIQTDNLYNDLCQNLHIFCFKKGLKQNLLKKVLKKDNGKIIVKNEIINENKNLKKYIFTILVKETKSSKIIQNK